MTTEIEIRRLSSLADADQVVRVQIETWGEEQVVPREMVRAMCAAGDLVQGAFRRNRLVGFALGFMAANDEGMHLHSHMLAVIPEEQGRGIGYTLKMAQRDAALEAGVTVMRWTFDPLVARNAHLNLSKLGAWADGFTRDFYGEMNDSLNVGERSDRLWVRWDLDRPSGAVPDASGARILLDVGGSGEPVPSTERRDDATPAVVRIPRDYPALRSKDPKLASLWRDASAEAIEACLEDDLTAVAFLPDSSYLFA